MDIFFPKRKKILKKIMTFGKSIWYEKIHGEPNNVLKYLFSNLFIIFQHYYYAKSMFLTSLKLTILFRFFLFRVLLKLCLNQTFDWESSLRVMLCRTTYDI